MSDSVLASLVDRTVVGKIGAAIYANQRADLWHLFARAMSPVSSLAAPTAEHFGVLRDYLSTELRIPSFDWAKHYSAWPYNALEFLRDNGIVIVGILNAASAQRMSSLLRKRGVDVTITEACAISYGIDAAGIKAAYLYLMDILSLTQSRPESLLVIWLEKIGNSH